MTLIGRCVALSQEEFPETATVTIGELKFGLCHGHQIVPWGDTEALQNLQRKVGANDLPVVTVWGRDLTVLFRSWTVMCSSPGTHTNSARKSTTASSTLTLAPPLEPTTASRVSLCQPLC